MIGRRKRSRRSGMDLQILRDEIDLMVSQGLSYRSIGLMLQLSPATIHYHVKKNREVKLSRLSEREWVRNLFKSLESSTKDTLIMCQMFIDSTNEYTAHQVMTVLRVLKETISKKEKEWQKFTKSRVKREELIKEKCDLAVLKII